MREDMETTAGRRDGLRGILDSVRSRPAAVRAGAAIKAVLLPPLRAANAGIRRLAALTHRIQGAVEWSLPPTPAWADHHVDVYWQLHQHGNALFLERGFVNSLAIRRGARVLDLCCGDGFFASRVYAQRASEVVAVDIDQAALRFAARYNAVRGVRYVRADIRHRLPSGPFDNVVWDATIQYFERDVAQEICRMVKTVMAPDGVLSGYTIIESSSDPLFAHHRTRFESADDLADLLKSQFQSVRILETEDRARRNLYFFAAADDSLLPDAPK
jgi:SAM-dependent methyltransferase